MDKCDIKILIIDNMAYTRINIEKVLSSMGLQNVMQAENGEEALETFRDYMPQLVILDLTLPKVDSINVLRLVLKMNSNSKIIICGETEHPEDYEKALMNGAFDYFSKPIDENVLLKKINKACDEIIKISDKEEKESASNVDVTKKFDINLNSDKSLQIINLFGTINSEDMEDLRNTVISLQLYNYINVILNFTDIPKLNIDIKEMVLLKEIIEEEGGKFFFISSNSGFKSEMLETELSSHIVENMEQAESLIG